MGNMWAFKVIVTAAGLRRKPMIYFPSTSFGRLRNGHGTRCSLIGESRCNLWVDDDRGNKIFYFEREPSAKAPVGKNLIPDMI
jgi:hypothetical protein